MKVVAPLAAFVLFAASTAAIPEPLFVYDPLPATVCQPLEFTWSGGSPPYTVTVARVLSGVISDTVEQFAAQSGTSYNWVVDVTPIPGGETLVLSVVDSAGNFSHSSPFSLQDNTDHSCLTVKPLVVYNLPTATVCEPLAFTWSGGTGPYSLFIAKVISETQADDVEQFPAQIGTSFNWVVDINPTLGGEALVLKVVDALGKSNQSFPFNIQDGTDHSCLTASPSSSSISGTFAPIPTSGTISTTSSQSPAKPSMIAEGKILAIGVGILAAVLLLALWRLYILRTRRRSFGKQEDGENLVDQKFQLSEFQKH